MDNLNNIRRETSRHFRNKKKEDRIEDRISINNIKKTLIDKEVAISSVIIQGDSSEEVKEISEKWIQSGSTNNLEHQAVKAVRSSKRLKKTTLSLKMPHILCFSEHHLKQLELEQINLEDYKLSAAYCRKSLLK